MGPLADLPARHVVEPALLRWAAARGGLGPAVLPCFVGEADPELTRLPGSAPRITAELWLLEHPELRRTARVQALGSWLAGALARAAPRLVGAAAGDGPGENLR
jgi:DNA-binding transcriptional LysR family regulator